MRAAWIGIDAAPQVIESLSDELLNSGISNAVSAFSDAMAMHIQPRTVLKGQVDCLLPLMSESNPEPHRLAAAVCLGSILRHGQAGPSHFCVHMLSICCCDSPGGPIRCRGKHNCLCSAAMRIR